MKYLPAILFPLLFLFRNEHLVAQTTKEEKIAIIVNFSVQPDIGHLEKRGFMELSFRAEPLHKKKPVHWYGQISAIYGNYTSNEWDSSFSWALTGGISIHPAGKVFMGFGAGPYLITDQGKKKFFWGFTPHIGFETYRFKYSLGVTILQKRKNGVDVLSLTAGLKFPLDDENP